MNIVLLGGPGSGKGTVSGLLEKNQNIVHIATGDMFREEIKNETELGKKAQEYINQGKLVPDEITINMLKSKINEFKDANGVVFDGFPRNRVQAEALEKMLEEMGQKVDIALYLDMPDEDIIYRTVKRRICSNKDCGEIYNLEFKKPKQEGICDVCGSKLIQRKDDNEETITNRLKVYHEQSKDLIKYYEEMNLIYRVELHANIDITEKMTKEWIANYNSNR